MSLFFITFLSLMTTCYSNKPNIVLVLTDDQDLVLGGLKPMTRTQQLVGNKGITLANAFVTTPICCPSRSSLLTGKYLHNHGTVNNSVSGGCYNTNWVINQEPHSFVTHLKAAGYTTFYAGKYLNQYGHNMADGAVRVPPGWDWWLGLVGNSRYYNYTLSVNGTAKHFSDEYLTDVIKRYGLEFLKGKQGLDLGFCMVLAPPAPHAPFIPSPKYKDHFKDVKAFKSPNFNVPVGKDKHWLLRMSPSPLPVEILPTLDEVYRHRWETLLSVDDLVESVIMELDSAGVLNNTFFMFTSDHGYHIGQFGLPWDKRQPYESDIRVPFLVRGPGVPQKQIMTMPVLNIDIAPTVLDIAGIPIPTTMDGNSFLPYLLQPRQTSSATKMFLIEYHGEGSQNSVAKQCGYKMEDTLSECSLQSMCKCQDAKNNTYSCIRVLHSDDNILYCQFEDTEVHKSGKATGNHPDLFTIPEDSNYHMIVAQTNQSLALCHEADYSYTMLLEQNFVELYDLKTDPYQLYNMASNSMEKLQPYNKMLTEFKTCQGMSCRYLARKTF